MFKTPIHTLAAAASLALTVTALAPAAFAQDDSNRDLVPVNYSYCDENPWASQCQGGLIQPPRADYRQGGAYRGATHERQVLPVNRQHG